MILCAMPECQTTAGCMCPKRVSMSYPNADLNRVGLLQDEITRLRSELANARNAALEEAETLVRGYPLTEVNAANVRWRTYVADSIAALKAEGESR
jgi:hypothetical protein